MNKIIKYDDDEAAKLVKLECWESSKGNHYKEERAARYDGSTHYSCDSCQGDSEKPYTKCSPCRNKLDKDRYLKMPFKEWDGETPLLLGDEYFFCREMLEDYCYNEEINLEEAELIICEPNYIYELDGNEFYEDIMPEDQSLDECCPTISDAFEALNKIIREHKIPISWNGGKFRTTIKMERNEEYTTIDDFELKHVSIDQNGDMGIGGLVDKPKN